MKVASCTCLAVATAVMLLSGCGGSKSGAPVRAIFVLFDISRSTDSTVVRQRYFDDFVSVVQSCKGGEVIMGDIITENTLASASFPINQTFPEDDPITTNEMLFRRAMKKACSSLCANAHNIILKSPPASRTDLMNSFELADKILNGGNNRGSKSKILVVFSDMVEQSPHYDFASVRLDQKRIKAIIEAERASGRLPDLHGVRVWVAGATATPHHGLDSSKINSIQNFWVAYFKACGADFSKYRYSQRLINFNPPRG